MLLLNRGITRLHSGLAVRILAPSESQRLRARVDDLAASRAGAVEAAQDQLERIERDLHDGAQARLVGLAMERAGCGRRCWRNAGSGRRSKRWSPARHSRSR